MIELKDIRIEFNRVVLDSFSCSIGGGINVLDGESGSGKSTIIKLILGESVPFKGEVIVPSYLVFSYCGPDASLIYDKTFLDNLRLFFGLGQLPETLSKLANDIGAASLLSKKIENCSGGERRKLEILFCLCKNADLYILDEPFSALDEVSKSVLRDFLIGFRRKKNFLIVNHDKTVDLPYDHLVKIKGGRAFEEGDVIPLSHSASSHQGKRLSVLKTAWSLFRQCRLSSIIESFFALAGVILSLLAIACIPCDKAYANRKIVEVDPCPTQLYEASEVVDFEEFKRWQDNSLLVFPMGKVANESFVSTNGYLASYDGPDFLILHGQGGKSGFALQPDFSYVKDGATQQGQFTFIEDGDSRLSFLSSYRRFESIGESTMLFLCPKEELPYVVCSIVNGDFIHQSYVKDGPVYSEMEHISLLCPTLAYGFLEYNDRTSSHPFLTPEDDYRFSSSRSEGGFVKTNRNQWQIPCEEGEDSMSFGAYAYFSFHSGLLGYAGCGLLGIGKVEALENLEFENFAPLDVIQFDPGWLKIKQLYFALGAGGAFFIFAIVAIFGAESKRKRFISLRQTLMHNGDSHKKANRKLAFSIAAPYCLSLLVSYLLYFALILPCVNYWQMSLDYPLGYGSIGPLYERISMLWFHLPSWWLLALVAGAAISLIQFALLSRRKR